MPVRPVRESSRPRDVDMLPKGIFDRKGKTVPSKKIMLMMIFKVLAVGTKPLFLPSQNAARQDNPSAKQRLDVAE